MGSPGPPLPPKAPPLPPSPLAGDRAAARGEARLPWHTAAASFAGGMVAGAALWLILEGPGSTAPPWVPLATMGAIGAAAAVCGTLLTAADRLVQPRWRALSWALSIGVPGFALVGWVVQQSHAWEPLVLAPFLVLLGLALALATRLRRALPWMSLVGAGLVGGLTPVTTSVAWSHSTDAVELAKLLGLGAVAVGPFGLAVGLCLYIERKRTEGWGG